MNYDCAVATVRKHMWKLGTDCNGDGVVTCEDYILIHRYGQARCRNYVGVDGGSMFFEHQPCLRNKPVDLYNALAMNVKAGNYFFVFKFLQIEEDITDQATYDQSVGFTVNGTVDFKAIYICSSSWLDNQYSYTPLDSRNQVPSQIYFNNSGDPGQETTVSCTIEAERFDSINLILASCQSLTQCDLKFRPHDVSFSN